ncbi:MAG TPA: sigma 54-interacting transcriptional regulator, partial [Candidatus Nanopelagicales bacterium]|nr:sigma 54-interacting transcriptional regulator [Candidatus Nanopelagicales bacterium]
MSASVPPPSSAGAQTTQPISSGLVQRARAEQERHRVALVVGLGEGARVAFLEADAPLVVGRQRPAGLRIADTALSREHARFTLRGERVLVEDLDSTNGTWRDGEQIQQAELAPGDSVLLGGLPVSVQAFRPGAVRVISSVPEEDEVPAGAAMRKVMAAAARLADAQLPVLLFGETGVGKEMMARRIHQGGPRHHRGKLICLNCAAIPAQLVESTLFGHERGAFTGAAQRQVGAFEE